MLRKLAMLCKGAQRHRQNFFQEENTSICWKSAQPCIIAQAFQRSFLAVTPSRNSSVSAVKSNTPHCSLPTRKLPDKLQVPGPQNKTQALDVSISNPLLLFLHVEQS